MDVAKNDDNKGIFHDSTRLGICEKLMELSAFVQKL